MAYDPTKPIVTDSPAYDVAQIQTNFASLKTLIDVNHVTFDIAGSGKHNFVQFPPLTGTIPKTETDEYALFGTAAGLYVRKPGTPAGVVGTNDTNITNAFGSSTLAADGYCYLPCGAKMAWGSVSAIHNATTTFTYSTISGFPGFTSTPFSVQLTGEGTTGDSPVYYTNLTSTSVGVYNSSGTSRTCKILVIGL